MEKKEDRPADRLKQLAQWYIDHKVFRGMNMFEEACGLSERYVKNLCATVKGNPGVDSIAKVYQTFRGVSLHWLVLGEGDMFTVDEDEALRAGRDATDEFKKKAKIRSMLNNKTLKGMTREEKIEFVKYVLEDKKVQK